MINIPLPKILLTISKELIKRDAKMILVGGCVRDSFLEIGIKDYDIEVYGLGTLEALEEILQSFGKVKLVGKSFGILKFVYEGREYDFAFPRTEEKIGKGHRGFSVCVDGFLEFKKASKRRDFTINAIGYDVCTKSILDPFGGKEDLEKKILRHIDDDTFVEDPLRVYRGIQFCARFELKMDKSTKHLCQKMIENALLEELPKERVFEEIKKLLLKADKPSIGWRLLKEMGGFKYFPSLEKLSDELFQKSMHRVDMMASLVKDFDEKEALILMLSILSLDLESKWVKEFIFSLTNDLTILKSVERIVSNFSDIDKLSDAEDIDAFVRVLSTKVIIKRLIYIAKALKHPNTLLLESTAKKLNILEKAPIPLIGGKDLLKMGYKPSKKFKVIIDRVYNLQLLGKIQTKDEAFLYLTEFMKDNEVE